MLKFLVCTVFFFPIACMGVIEQKVLICGVCRDVEQRLPYTIEIIEKMGALFEDYRVLIYENNSKDKTVKILKNWAKINSRIVLRCETVKNMAKSVINVNRDGTGFRPELIARARNVVQDIAMSQQFEDFQYLIWVDMDFKISPAFKGIVEVFETDREWDAVLAYGVDKSQTYWDWYAHRDATYPIGSELLGNVWWYMPKQFSLSKKEDWYPVYSAFGGCGIYKKDAIVGCRYSAIVTEDLAWCAEKILSQGKSEGHPQIALYQDLLDKAKSFVEVPYPRPGLSLVEDPDAGILLQAITTPVIWRMSSFVYQYPSVCEHVPFHASMIRRGHGKIYINPRLVFTYGD